MPAEISTVGAIARANRRSLLLLSFHDRSLEARWASGPCHLHGSFYQQWMADRLEAWKTHAARQHLIDWLACQGIGWQPCAPFLPGWVHAGSYWGDMCLDISCTAQDPRYRALQAYLQPPGSMHRFENVTLFRGLLVFSAISDGTQS